MRDRERREPVRGEDGESMREREMREQERRERKRTASERGKGA